MREAWEGGEGDCTLMLSRPEEHPERPMENREVRVSRSNPCQLLVKRIKPSVSRR